MSEVNNTPESIDEGIPEVSFTLQVEETVQAPVDDTLTIQGQAADARATGLAIEAAKAELQEEIDALDSDITGIANTLYPVGTIYMSTSASAPTFGAANWNWQEIMLPTTWGNLEDGSRSYRNKESGDTAGSVHFWLRIDDTEVSE